MNYAAPPKSKVNKLSGGGLFEGYEWLSDPYENFLVMNREKRLKDKEAIKALHGATGQENFVLGMN